MTLIRRWLQISLRFLFVVITLAALPLAWFAHQLETIRERHALLAVSRSQPVPPDPFCIVPASSDSAGYWLNLVGEPNVSNLKLFLNRGEPLQADAIERAARLFPEAKIWVYAGGKPDFAFGSGSTKVHMYPGQDPAPRYPNRNAPAAIARP